MLQMGVLFYRFSVGKLDVCFLRVSLARSWRYSSVDYHAYPSRWAFLTAYQMFLYYGVRTYTWVHGLLGLILGLSCAPWHNLRRAADCIFLVVPEYLVQAERAAGNGKSQKTRLPLVGIEAHLHQMLGSGNHGTVVYGSIPAR